MALQLWLFVGVAFLTGLLAGAVAVWYYRERTTLDETVNETLAAAGDEPVEFEPVNVSLTPLDWIKAGRHLQKQRKAAKKGYVKWHRVGSNLSRPQWVKPEKDGSGVPKYRHNGEPYYFPPEAMTTDAQTGAHVAVHREGEADPINLEDPAYPGLPTDLVERTINLEAESDPPGFLDSFGMSMQTLMWLAIIGSFIVYAGIRYLG